MPTRRPRLSLADTEQRVLAAAVEQVNATGLTVSLEHLSFEALIAAADVSRTAAYRRWPTKELFLGDLLPELARAAKPRAIVLGDSSAALIRELVLTEPHRLAEAGYRRRLAAEVIRRATDLDFQLMHASAEWRTYLGLHATFASLPDVGLREEVQAALASAQHQFVTSLARSWRALATALGYRLRSPELSFEDFAESLSGSIRGLLLMAMADPAAAERRVEADPFDTGSAPWSVAALSCAALALAFLEPDPELTWDDARIDAVAEALAALPASG